MRYRHESARYAVLCFLLAAVAGCGAMRMVLEKPVADQCASAGLSGCPQLTEGILLYVEGDQAAGQAKLQDGIRANAADKLKGLAESLHALDDLPGSDSFMGPLRQVIALLEQGADDDAASPRKRERGAKPADDEAPARRAHRRPSEDDDQSGEGEADAAREKSTRRVIRAVRPAGKPTGEQPRKVGKEADGEDAGKRRALRASPHRAEHPERATLAPAGLDPTRIESGTASPATDKAAAPCDGAAAIIPGIGSRAACVRAAVGPIVVTDLHASGACPSDLMVVVGDGATARWVMHVPARTPLHVTGARLSAAELDTVVVAIASPGDDARRGVRCAVTWSGWRP